MSDRKLRVLFLCTGNSARSVLAEALLNHLAPQRFVASSAGSQPTGRVNPLALELLASESIATSGLRSKSWDEFAAADAPPFDFIFTVCDNAAREACPVWPGHPASAHWGLPDPAAAQGSAEQQRQAFADAFACIGARLRRFIALPLAELRPEELGEALRAIGREA